MNAATVSTILRQWSENSRRIVLDQVACRERAGLEFADQEIAALASWFSPMTTADVQRGLWVRWLLDTGRIADLALGN